MMTRKGGRRLRSLTPQAVTSMGPFRKEKTGAASLPHSVLKTGMFLRSSLQSLFTVLIYNRLKLQLPVHPGDVERALCSCVEYSLEVLALRYSYSQRLLLI